METPIVGITKQRTRSTRLVPAGVWQIYRGAKNEQATNGPANKRLERTAEKRGRSAAGRYAASELSSDKAFDQRV